MLFTPISFTALLLFVVTVSSVPLHGPAAGVRAHADQTSGGLSPAPPRCVKEYSSAIASPAAAQGARGAFAPAHAASHVQFTPPDASLESPDDIPTRKYARSTPPAGPNAAVQHAHALAAAAHRAAATAHHHAAARELELATQHLGTGNFAAMTAARRRADAHDAKAGKHEEREEYHTDRETTLANHAPLRNAAAAVEIERANGSREGANRSARNA
ncbi:hypothetical protein HYPSUDRAFT_206382 [Hypholoma sublateritium FD-334 SS-4]|uniref:DUF1771 domain-containing protein n=1 Tax=Hypholoma sublateritium (strain FD-334 SS-4) TaxID=945553 RepID=A0A0D2NKX8_HYPSF|nr:hypothetical protein HYPSUDRAFT_206382 [Hypholoma sublateritium FD-334 SS-4]